MKKKGTEVNCLECPECHQLIYSRAIHDFHSCKCRNISIDGGFEYMRCSWHGDVPPETKQVSVLATMKELYDDWNYGYNKFGWIEQVDESSNDSSM